MYLSTGHLAHAVKTNNDVKLQVTKQMKRKTIHPPTNELSAMCSFPTDKPNDTYNYFVLIFADYIAEVLFNSCLKCYLLLYFCYNLFNTM